MSTIAIPLLPCQAPSSEDSYKVNNFLNSQNAALLALRSPANDGWSEED